MTWLADLTLDTAIVHTTVGESFKGVVGAVHDDCVVMRETLLLQDPPVVLEGDIVILRENVHFMQLVRST